MLKWFFLQICFRGDIREICDCMQAHTVQSQKIKFSTIQNWLTHSAQANTARSQTNLLE